MIQIYIIGCIIAFVLLLKAYQAALPDVCELKESIPIFVIGTFGSWFTVLTIILLSEK